MVSSFNKDSKLQVNLYDQKGQLELWNICEWHCYIATAKRTDHRLNWPPRLGHPQDGREIWEVYFNALSASQP